MNYQKRSQSPFIASTSLQTKTKLITTASKTLTSVHPFLRSIQSLSHVQLFATPWTAAPQASLMPFVTPSPIPHHIFASATYFCCCCSYMHAVLIGMILVPLQGMFLLQIQVLRLSLPCTFNCSILCKVISKYPIKTAPQNYLVSITAIFFTI